VIEAVPSHLAFSDAYRGRGVAWSYQEQFEKALTDFNEAVRLDPTSAVALSTRAYEFSRRGDCDTALRDIAAAFELQPEDASLFVQRGYTWLDKKDYARAVEDFSTAIRLAPRSADGYGGRANARYDQGRLDEALADWDIAIKLSPNEYALYVERGTVHRLKNRCKEAWDDFSAAIRLAADQPEGYVNRAELMLRSSDPELLRPAEALADAQRACELTDWRSAYEISVLASACAATSDFDGAVRWQLKALACCDPYQRREFLAALESYKAQQQKDKRADE
jgi:tetratricopeptide (TPR) repeat protein